MKIGCHIHLIKVSAIETPAGHFPVSYWVRGVLFEDVKVGQPIHVARYARAAQEKGEPSIVSRLGEYKSSNVIAISQTDKQKALGQTQLRTENSIWLLTELPPLDEEAKGMLKEMIEFCPVGA